MDFPCTRVDCPLESVPRRNKDEVKRRADERKSRAQEVQDRRKFHEQMRKESYQEELRIHEEGDRKRTVKPSGKEKATLHASEVRRRKQELDQERSEQINHDINVKYSTDRVRQRPRSANAQRHALKAQQAAQMRAALLEDRQEQVEDELKSKQEAAESRIKNTKSNRQLNRTEVKMKNQQKQSVVRQRRDDIEYEQKCNIEEEIKQKDKRTAFNLGIEEKPKLVRKQYVPTPKPKIEPEEDKIIKDEEDEVFDRLFDAMYGVWRRNSEVSDDDSEEERALELSLAACGITDKEQLYPHMEPPCPSQGWQHWDTQVKAHAKLPPRWQVRAAQLKALGEHHKKLQKEMAKFRGLSQRAL